MRDTLEAAIARAHPADDPIVQLRQIAQLLTVRNLSHDDRRRCHELSDWLDRWLDRYAEKKP